ncbi:protein NO VEIN domain-containing protein [Actinomycetospora sp. CA-101289]|uniref:protein NO VEIN domain-containing protein n=1 Tax=Actinomycetospora sp. CA-101289 TaxID=3239893 RepID=UPI003D967531
MVNEWWVGDASQRFWMEITNRRDVGSDLNAPQRDGAGNESWTYSLVAATRPGDVVFHWHTDWFENSALIGWSEIAGPLEEVYPYAWQARGTRGRARGVPTVGRGWRTPCANFTELTRPVDGARMFELRDSVLQLGEDLKRRHGTTYFPFTRYGDGLRAAQAYLTKFPAELLGLLPELAEAMVLPGPPPSARPRKGAGRLQDPVLRKAIEEHAVAVAKEHYLAAGATEVEVLGKPYDLLVRGPSGERHVEVKGSSLRIDKVLLTINEVIHARGHEATDLVVVDEIEWRAEAEGTYTTAGGRWRIWRSWSPQDEQLSALQFLYDLGEKQQ